jgi:glycosyltransferase involved in cell wall biosynthesis
MSHPKITLAVTHYNRLQMVLQCIEPALHDNRISEIVIQDDASNDGSYEQLFEFAVFNSKVRLFRNPQNLDCYRNKREAVASARNPWVILFDSDNVFTIEGYLNVIWRLPEWNSNNVYCPTFAMPHFDYRSLEGLCVTRRNVAEQLNQTLLTAMNTANYFVCREEYLRVWDGSINPHTADSLFQNLNWLKKGNSLVFVPGLQYLHRVHAGSHYKNNVHKTGDLPKRIERELRQLR